MSLSTYLTFDGNCRAAFEFYRSVFGGEFAEYLTFAEGPPDLPVTEEEKSRIMHVALPVGSGLLMGSDTFSLNPPVAVGNNFSISIDADGRERCDELFAKLSDGGKVMMPQQDVFWGAYFGQCTDRFGINWMVSYTPPTE